MCIEKIFNVQVHSWNRANTCVGSNLGTSALKITLTTAKVAALVATTLFFGVALLTNRPEAIAATIGFGIVTTGLFCVNCGTDPQNDPVFTIGNMLLGVIGEAVEYLFLNKGIHPRVVIPNINGGAVFNPYRYHPNFNYGYNANPYERADVGERRGNNGNNWIPLQPINQRADVGARNEGAEENPNNNPNNRRNLEVQPFINNPFERADVGERN